LKSWNNRENANIRERRRKKVFAEHLSSAERDKY